eukprot:TRINITY_DN7697_c0_g1_i1.p1 TRINITY_DN7697_c0_g1~~TRINITY_DN7697_c0_g1_i1.p1  ORF type:complete len:272 (+),score=46.35 TRINITY_DN7697_c0_g1_i1:73-888(+)
MNSGKGKFARQARCLSNTAPLLRHHARMQNKHFFTHYFFNNVAMNPANRRFQYRPSPLHGKRGLDNYAHEEHPWDYFHNARPTGPYSEKGISVQKFLPFTARLRNWITASQDMHRESARMRLYIPWWGGDNNFRAPPHLMLPPGYRPMTEFPTSRTREYHSWMELPHVRRVAPITNTPDIMTKFAADRAKKMDILKFALAASNFRVTVRAKFESKKGDLWLGAKSEHKTGGNMATAGPSPLYSFWGAKKDGEVFSGGAGPGTYPRPNDKGD